MQLFFARVAGQVLVIRAKDREAAERIIHREFSKDYGFVLTSLVVEGPEGIVLEVTG